MPPSEAMKNAGITKYSMAGHGGVAKIIRRVSAASSSSPSALAMTIFDALDADTINEAVNTITPSGGDTYGTRPIRIVSRAKGQPKRWAIAFASSLSAGVTWYVVHTSATREQTASPAIT